ncbi:MAG: AAA family ATPase, partial [Bacteroidaceae bacterium]|nr:AAA family ATPase [Bacteroidaceae bacterium]
MIDTKEKTDEEVLQNLHELIGLRNVKEKLKEIYYRMRRDRLRMNAGLPVEEEDLVFVFAGSPGTGKTTVARMLGGILHDLGLLTSSDCVEKKKGDIVDNFAGGTEKNVEKLFADNVGKTLFIDEAYALCENNNKSVVTQIVGLLTDERYKRKMALVLAGYPDDMSQFLSMNDGMTRRVKHIIQFDNYSNEELWQILQFNMRRLKRHFVDEELCHQLALAWFGLIPRTNKFGNASESEKLLGILEQNNDKRLRAANNESTDLMNEYRPEDFPKGAYEVLNLHKGSEGQSLEDTVEASGNGAEQPMVSLDLTKEDEAHRATCVEHLEHSVGLLTCEGGVNSEKAQGTAFIISLHNHYLLTCSHVVEGKTKFTFSISELQFETPARLLWNNSQCDMALLQVGILPQEARYLQLCKDEKPVGKTTKITLAGYPLGEAVS